jgi:hypothetical protein
VVERFSTAPFRYWISGGHALELWAGRSWRAHGDIDVGLLRSDIDAALPLLPELHLYVAAAGGLARFEGQRLLGELHRNNVWAFDPATSRWVLDLTLGDGDDLTWVYRRDQTLQRAWPEAVLTSPQGIPYLAPELQLLFKSRNPRAKDNIDARETLPLLDAEQRAFLFERLPAEHPWRSLAV